MENELKLWIEWLKSKGLSERSIKNYYFYYCKFNFESYNQEYVIRFLSKYKNPVARAFIKNTLEFLKDKNIEIPKITGRKKIRYPDVYSRDEINQVSKAMRTERNKIMVLVNFYAGLRVSELVNIKPYDFKWKLWGKNTENVGYIKIIGKGNKQRTVFIPGELMGRVYNWIRTYVSEIQDKEDPLFNIGVRRYQALLNDASEKAIKKRISPHALRHSCATYLLEHGLNIKEVAEFLGHSSINTTQIYLHIVSKKNLAEKIKKAYE